MHLCNPQEIRVTIMITEMLAKELIFLFFLPTMGICCRFPVLFRVLLCFCPGQTSTGRERNQGKEPSLSFSTSTLPSLSLSLCCPFISPLYSLSSLKAVHFSSSVFVIISSRVLPFFGFFFPLCFFGLGKKMGKGKNRFSMDPVSSASFTAEEEARARFKYRGLLQDYLELLQETKEKREELKRAMKSKLKLLAEVKYLRKKHRSFSNTTQGFPCKVKEQSYKNLSPSKQVKPPHCPVIETEMSLKERNSKPKEVSLQSAPRLIDLNQVSTPNGEEMDAFDMDWEPLKMDDDLKFSVWRDIGRSSSQVGKRKISWQDQLALRV